MSNIKNIIFDFGNVLFDLDLSRIGRHFQQYLGPQAALAARDQIQANRVVELYETGGLSTAEFVDALRFTAPATGLPLSEAQVLTAWNDIFLGMPRDRFDLLLRLRERYQVFLLSNINPLHADWIDAYMLREHGIEDFQTRYFDGVYYSHLIRLRKPDLDCFGYVLADAELVPEETVFIDDLEINVAAARSLGLRGIVHPEGEDIVVRMQEFLV